MEDKIQSLLKWIKDHTPADNGVLIPLSGGTDSALCFWLYCKALPEKTLGVHLGPALRARTWFEEIGAVRSMDLSVRDPINADVARWAQALSIALAENRVLIGTRNRTEHILGTYSTASRAAFHLPLVGLWKTDVLALCDHIGVPKEVIVSSREADPVCGRPETIAKIPFDTVDTFAKEKIGVSPAGAASLDPAQRAYLEGLYAYNAFKSTLPLPGPTI